MMHRRKLGDVHPRHQGREIDQGDCKMIHAGGDGKSNGVGITVSGKYVRAW